MLGQLQTEFPGGNVDVVAINIWPANYSLQEWVGFWQQTGDGDALCVQDANNTAILDYQLMALGTEIIVDRKGVVVFRSDSPAGFERLRSEIERVL